MHFLSCRTPRHDMKISRSIASRHYPRIVFRNGERMLWNPLKRQALRFRPEERIRLQVLDYLILESSIPSARIAVESPVPSRFSRGRTDLLCYDSQFQPLLLIECKADTVRLGPRAATQSAVYNRFVKAPCLMLTNGLEDAFFHVANQLEAIDKSDYPAEFVPDDPDWHSADPDYWMERGFLPPGLPATAATALAHRLALLFHLSQETRSWLSIPFPGRQMPLTHHHLLLSAAGHPDTLIAVTFCAVTPETAVFSAVANRKKRNIAYFCCSLGKDGTFRDPQLFPEKNDDIPESGSGMMDDSLAPALPSTLPSGDSNLMDLNDFWLSLDDDPVSRDMDPITVQTGLTTERAVRSARRLARILERLLLET
ncbi:MAG: type I restriction enzyme HsdR N-terminal domain-containing protein [Balneolaceae bacterium]|nr:MAG: type I restriction enzyme HsdR N-terminal domain-containing protein [Balneolaceae bacterium]